MKLRKPEETTIPSMSTPVQVVTVPAEDYNRLQQSLSSVNRRLDEMSGARDETGGIVDPNLSIAFNNKVQTSLVSKFLNNALESAMNPQDDPVTATVKQVVGNLSGKIAENILSNISGGTGQKQSFSEKVILTIAAGVGPRMPELLETGVRLLGSDTIKQITQGFLGQNVGSPGGVPPGGNVGPGGPNVQRDGGNGVQGQRSSQDAAQQILALDPNNPEHVAAYADNVLGGVPTTKARSMLMQHQDMFIEQMTKQGMNQEQINQLKMQRGSKSSPNNSDNINPGNIKDNVHINDDTPPQWAIMMMNKMEDLERKVQNVQSHSVHIPAHGPLDMEQSIDIQDGHIANIEDLKKEEEKIIKEDAGAKSVSKDKIVDIEPYRWEDKEEESVITGQAKIGNKEDGETHIGSTIKIGIQTAKIPDIVEDKKDTKEKKYVHPISKKSILKPVQTKSLDNNKLGNK